MKTCRKCLTTDNLKRARDICKPCANEYMSQWRRDNPEKYMLTTVRARARKAGLECTISTDDIHIPTKCPVLGITLSRQGRKKQCSSPSIDRIDSSKGYIPGNIRVISDRANMLKNNASLEELELVLSDARRLAVVNYYKEPEKEEKLIKQEDE